MSSRSSSLSEPSQDLFRMASSFGKVANWRLLKSTSSWPVIKLPQFVLSMSLDLICSEYFSISSKNDLSFSDGSQALNIVLCRFICYSLSTCCLIKFSSFLFITSLSRLLTSFNFSSYSIIFNYIFLICSTLDFSSTFSMCSSSQLRMSLSLDLEVILALKSSSILVIKGSSSIFKDILDWLWVLLILDVLLLLL